MSAANLAPAQRRIVLHPPDAGHLLVLAGPGAGKTRTLVERIHHLLHHEHCEPEHILAMTFTLQAATEIRDRLAAHGHEGVTAGTFHHVCARLLTDHGSAIGVASPLRILDRPRQDEALLLAATTSGATCERRGDLSLDGLRSAISQRKRAGRHPDDGVYPNIEPRAAGTVRAIDEAYTKLLEEHGALDYDDLLIRGIALLRTDPDTAAAVRARVRFVFLDEFHDLSPDQFALLHEIAPPAHPRTQVMAVADPNQAIFGFRDADPSRILPEFRRLYRPRRFRLSENFRSTAAIVHAASTLVPSDSGGPALVATLDIGSPISCLACADETHEAAVLVDRITAALQSGHYDGAGIAVLYRANARADAAESALLAAGIPIRRVQRDRFFDEPDVQESLRYLDLIATLHDHDLSPALNWPRVLVDEPTMIHLRRLAQARNCTLAELAASIDTLTGDVSPITRAVISGFLTGIAAELHPVADGPLPVLIDRLLTLLARRRSPIPTAERDTLHGLLAFLAPPLTPALVALQDALAAGHPVAIHHAGDPDTTAAAVILEHTLASYLRHPVTIGRSGDILPADALTIDLRRSNPDHAPATVTLSPRVLRDISYPVALLAWRLGQMLLMSYETLDRGPFTVLDLETGSPQAKTTQILELAALRLDAGVPTGESFSTLVRPDHPRSITYGATQVHGIRWHDVAGAPLPAGILPAFFAFLGTDTLVGHNIDDFDGRVLHRIGSALDLPTPNRPTIDTATLARRLLPNRSHKLEDLAR